jgi:diguanylate cyclase
MALTLNKRKIAGMLSIVAVMTAAIGTTGLLQPLSLSVEMLQKKIRSKAASGEVVIVGIDSPSIKDVGRWPWPRSKQAELLQRIDQKKPKAIFVDIGYQGTTEASEDGALRKTLAEMQSETKIIALASEDGQGNAKSVFSHRAVVGNAQIVSAYFPYLFGYVWEIPLNIPSDRGGIPSLSADAANIKTDQMTTYKVDYSIDPKTIPQISAKEILNKSAKADALAGKTVIIGVTDVSQNDVHSMPGWGEHPGVLFHAIGVETLRRGLPTGIGWLPFFVISLLLGLILLTKEGLRRNKHVVFGGISATLAASSSMTVAHIHNDPLPAIAFLLTSGIYIGRQKAALLRAQRNHETGFNNTAGYMVDEVLSTGIFVAATFTVADTMKGMEKTANHTQIVKAVGHRLSAVIDEKQITHNDEGQFVWEMPSMNTDELGHHLAGLRKLFAPRVEVDGNKIDADIFFGIDRDVMSSIRQRSQNAIAASVEARNTASSYIISAATDYLETLEKHFGSEFSKAVISDEVAIMLEATKDLKTGRIQSAEAAVRWNHPGQGHISASRVLSMAQATNNLDLLFDYVVSHTVRCAAELKKIDRDFSVSFKIPTRMLTNESFTEKLLATLAAASCNPDALTLDIIDFREYRYNNAAIAKIQKLREAGIQIGIGDFGTSTDDIHLLLAIKCDELFLTKSFSHLLATPGQRILADAALRIARVHNIQATADNVEDRNALAELRHMGCHKARGKIIAMPLTIQDFIQTHMITADKKTG